MDPTTSWFSLLTGSYNKDCGMCYPVCGILQITFLLPTLYTTVVVTMGGGGGGGHAKNNNAKN